MKKFLSLFCAVLMAVASVRAEEPASITPLTNGDNSVVIDNPTTGSEWYGDKDNYLQYTLFQYTASADGKVTIYSVGNLDTFGAFFDKDKNFISRSDDNGPGSNFQFEFDAKAGEVYYIGARGINDDVIGSYTIHVDYVDFIPSLNIGDNSVVIDNPTSGSEWNGDKENYSHYTLFKFTALADCGLITNTPDDKFTWSVLYDKDKHYIAGTFGVSFEIEAKAGDVFYIGVRGFNDTEIGSYTINVEEKTTHEAAIGDKKYYFINNALDNIKDGETLTLLADVAQPDDDAADIYPQGTITINLNGYTLYKKIFNYGNLTIEDSSEGKTGKMITLPGYYLFENDDEDNSITINGGTFIGGTITCEYGVFYINGGTFILPDESEIGYTMSQDDNIVFGDGIVYRDLSGEHEDISEVTENVTYSGKFVKAGTPTGIKDVDASKANKAQKTIKTIENGRVVIIRDGVRYDITGRKL